MPDLMKYTLFHDTESKKHGPWVSERDSGQRALKRFATKAEAIGHATGWLGEDSPHRSRSRCRKARSKSNGPTRARWTRRRQKGARF